MSDNQNDKGYSSLTGFKRAIPIILLALAAFTALCFITQETGALGRIISELLLGLFAKGAYAIPALLALHAIFYASDVAKSRTVSRIIFSVMALISLSAVIYTVENFGAELTFTPGKYYGDGAQGVGGGFIGSTIAFVIVKIFGPVGLIIIAALVIALYVSFFFAKGRGAAKKSFYGTLLFFAKLGARIEKGVGGAIGRFKSRKKDKAERLAQERTDELFDDEYFAVDNGLKELRISTLGIHEVRSDKSVEENPTLQSKVRHKSAEENFKRREHTETQDFAADYYNGAENKGSHTHLLADAVLEEAAPTVTESERAKYGLDCSADEIFTKDFSPIDFALDSSEANRPSSRGAAHTVSTAPEVKETLSAISERDIELARRKADFDMKKKAAFDAMHSNQESTAQGTAAGGASYERASQFISGINEQYTKTVPLPEYRREQEPSVHNTVYTPAPSAEPSVQNTVYTPAPSVERTSYEAASAEVDTITVKYESEPTHESAQFVIYDDEPTRAEESVIIDEPTSAAADISASEPCEIEAEPETITLTRSMMSPNPTLDESFENEASADSAEDKLFGYSVSDDVRIEIPDDEDIPAPEQDTDSEPIIIQKADTQSARLYTYSDDIGNDTAAPSISGEEEKAEEEKKKSPKPDYSSYKFPPLDILAKGDSQFDPNLNEEMEENGNKIIETLSSFNVLASIKGYDRGPRITRYEVVPAKGVRVNQVVNLFDDIALSLAAEGIRIEAPIPGKSAIGFELPNKTPETVRLRDLLETDEFKNAPSKTIACIGKDVTGSPVFGDIAKMPHILIAGATGMGKSVCINSILISILYKARPDEVKFILIDPKKVEFKMYNGIPHLLVPVVSDAKQAAGALMWAVEEMERRYDLIEEQNVRNIEGYNEKVRANPKLGDPLPKLIIVIDELNDLMLQVRDPVEGLIMSIAQKARAAGIHLIIGTQRPSVNVITGVIKANIPSRMSCKVASYTDSKTIIERAGAERLLDKGDMLYHPVGTPKPLRVQSAFVSDPEVYAVMDALKENAGMVSYDDKVMEDITRAAQKCVKGKGGSDDRDTDDGGGAQDASSYMNDRQFLEAVDIAVTSGKISTSLIQRRIGVGYGKAAKFIDIMESLGIVSEPNGQKPRETLITKDDWMERLANY